MKNRQRHTALFFSILIAAGFVSSGYHFHNHRDIPDDHSSETHLISAFDNCLFCEGVFLFDIIEPVSETELIRHPETVDCTTASVIFESYTQLPGNRAPPSV